MRILMISDHADPLAPVGSKEAGGQNIYVLNLSKFLARAGVAVDVYTRWDRSNKRKVVQVAHNFRVIRVKAGPKVYMQRDAFLGVIEEFVANIQKFIADEQLRYDVIYSNYWFSGIAGLQLGKSLALPQVHVYHSIGQNRFNALKRYITQKEDYVFYETRLAWEKQIARRVTGVIVTSPVEQQDVCMLFGVSKRKTKCIPVGVDTTIFRPLSLQQTRRRLHQPVDQPVILYVGRIEWRKGIETLLRAIALLPERWQMAKTYIVGGGRDAQERKLDSKELSRLKVLAKDLGLDERIQFVGARSQAQVPLYYAMADVCVVPSYYEPFGIVPLEAMACGTPVVASRTGGLQDTVVDGKTGLLATPGDAEDFADKITRVLDNGRDHYSHAALTRIKEQFVWQKVASDVRQYLQKSIIPKEKA